MGLYGIGGTGELPDYFNKDQVDGLTHWLQLSEQMGDIGDVNPYADALEAQYGVPYAKTCMTGLSILFVPDKEKMEFMYRQLPPDAPRDRLISHKLISVLLMRPEINKLLMSKQTTLDRALMYAEKWYIDAQELAEDYSNWMKG